VEKEGGPGQVVTVVGQQLGQERHFGVVHGVDHLEQLREEQNTWDNVSFSSV